ncbi:EAL domain-containing protein [Azospirillum halopraeferens]|uniref:EAL domain-containing protein n=1 Tax=Azospirillum halopraeferens TaxID=34010 RepID=UPI0003FA14B1|nr:EAL domain-containing protein [Azospirillum halopraeferens]
MRSCHVTRRRAPTVPVLWPAVLAVLCFVALWSAPLSGAVPLGAGTRVLILHSYHPGYEWTDRQDEGIRSGLHAIRPDAEPEVVFLDWKRHPTDANLDALETLLAHRFAGSGPDLIVSTDDAALAFGLRLRDRLFGPVPLVFGGVLRHAAMSLIADRAHVTGVYETKDIAGTVAMALELNPGYRRLHLISDRTESGRGLERELHDVLDAMGATLERHALGALPLVQLADRLAALPPDGFALFGSYSVDATGVVLAPERFVERLSERSAVPLFGLQENLLGHGLLGGSLSSPRDHGDEVGRLAGRILNGAAVTDLPPHFSRAIVRTVDVRQAARFGLDADRVSAPVRMVNGPRPFLGADRTLVLAMAGVIAMLSALSAGLALEARRRRRTERALHAANTDLMASRQSLQDTIADLTVGEESLRRSEQRLRLVMESARDIIWDWDLVNGQRTLSGRVREVLGYDAGAISDAEAWMEAIHPDDRDATVAALRRHLSGEAAEYRAVYRMRHRDGHFVWLSASGRALPDGEGRPVAMAGSYTDVTAEREREDRLDRLAHYDPLTGLPNRLHLAGHVDELLAAAKAGGCKESLALLMLDLDGFKYINDSFGHKAGDSLLVALARRLRGIVGSGFVSRSGGDEFVAVVRGEEAVAAAEMARKIEASFRAPFAVEGQNFIISCSIGIARYPWDGRCFDELLQNADTAMHWSKNAGPGRVSQFEPDMNRHIVDRLRLSSRLRTALEEDAFTLHYQPLASTADGRIRGFEALVRWTDSVLGAVPPARFVPVCEDSGMIIPLGLWVLESACRRAVALAAAGGDGLKMSVNVSVVQLSRGDFVPDVLRILDATGLAPRNLQLEITESLMMGNVAVAVARLEELNHHGIAIALDDFGTGYSSLTHLRRLPIQTLKLDKGFIDDVARSPDAHGMVQTITRMAGDMNRTVVAEGVEEAAQWEALSRIGCDLIQGFFVSPPLPADALDAFLAGWEERRTRLPLTSPAARVIDLAGRQGR